jgi:hypothetical protein
MPKNKELNKNSAPNIQVPQKHDLDLSRSEYSPQQKLNTRIELVGKLIRLECEAWLKMSNT